MKTLHTILTILLVGALILGLFPLLLTFEMLNHVPQHASATTKASQNFGIIIGNVLAYALIPGIIWLIRYFVGKEVERNENKLP